MSHDVGGDTSGDKNVGTPATIERDNEIIRMRRSGASYRKLAKD